MKKNKKFIILLFIAMIFPFLKVEAISKSNLDYYCRYEGYTFNNVKYNVTLGQKNGINKIYVDKNNENLLEEVKNQYKIKNTRYAINFYFNESVFESLPFKCPILKGEISGDGSDLRIYYNQSPEGSWELQKISENLKEEKIDKEYIYDGHETDKLSNTYQKYNCGGVEIPLIFPKIVKIVISILQYATPIIIIIFGMFDLAKSIMGQKEDEIKNGSKTFIKRLLIGIIVFVVVALVKVVIANFSGESESMISCFNCFVNGKC